MAKRSTLVSGATAVAVLAALLGRAVTVHSVGPTPLIYRVIANNNDLDAVEGLAPPGRTVGSGTGRETSSRGISWRAAPTRSPGAPGRTTATA